MGNSVLVASQTVPSLVAVSMPANTLLQNESSVISIYVGADPSVNPSSGTRIGPLGSVTWTQDKARVYAILDPAATPAPVAMLSVGSEVANPDNPVDVGAAIATELALAGLPLVLVTDTLENNVPVQQVGTSLLIDVSKYASVQITVAPNLGQFADIDVSQYADFVQSILVDDQQLSSSVSPGFGGQVTLTALVPVKAQWMQISNMFPSGTCRVTVLGTNRTATEVNTEQGKTGLHRWIQPSQALTIATIYDLQMQTGYPASNNGYGNFNGRCRVGLAVAGNVVKGEFLIKTFKNNAFFTSQFADTAEAGVHLANGNQTWYTDVSLPIDPYQISFVCRTAGTASLTVNIYRG